MHTIQLIFSGFMQWKIKTPVQNPIQVELTDRLKYKRYSVF
jgi:hypothetical protein